MYYITHATCQQLRAFIVANLDSGHNAIRKRAELFEFYIKSVDYALATFAAQ
jgi:hypothetical protein